MKGALILPGQTSTQQAYADPGERKVLDLNRWHFQHHVKDLRILGTWLRLPGEPTQACLVLLPLERQLKKNPDLAPVVIAHNSCWRWAEAPIGDPMWAAEEARRMCLLLGKNPNRKRDVWQVMETILDRLPDLLHIPPEPPAPQRVVAELYGLVNGVRFEREVFDRA